MTHVLGVEVQPTVEKEPVMDVPAIDMTDAAAEAATPPRRKKAKRAASARKRPAETARRC